MEILNIGASISNSFVENINSKYTKINAKNVLLTENMMINTFDQNTLFSDFLNVQPTPIPSYISVANVSLSNVNNTIKNFNDNKNVLNELINKNIKYESNVYPNITLLDKFDDKDNFTDKDTRFWSPILQTDTNSFVGVYHPNTPSRAKELHVITSGTVPIPKPIVLKAIDFWVKKNPKGTVLDFYNSMLYKRMHNLAKRNVNQLGFHYAKIFNLPVKIIEDEESFAEDINMTGYPKMIAPLSYQPINTLIVNDGKISFLQNCSQFEDNKFKVMVTDPRKEVIGFKPKRKHNKGMVHGIPTMNIGWKVGEIGWGVTNNENISLDVNNIESKLGMSYDHTFYYDPIVVKT